VGAVSDASELRRLYPRVLARTLSLTGSLADAEDAVQDAIERALGAWPRTGRPESMEGWLVTVAGNCHRDRLRRRKREERHADALTTLAEMSPWVQGAVAGPGVMRAWKDDLLRLLFACCSPALEVGESAALALSAVLGLAPAEIADAFLVAPRTMEQRLTRARRRLRERAPHDGMDAVLCTLHLLFNEGYWSRDDESPIRRDLCRLAVGLCRSLHEARPDEPEVTGLLALLLLHEARIAARLDADGAPVALPDQDRSRWDHALIREASAMLRTALGRGRTGRYQLEAAIAAVHCEATTAEATDWHQIVQLYALLEELVPGAVVRVNRAFAVSRVDGPAAGLALLDGMGSAEEPYLALVRGVLLGEVGRLEEAVAELHRAESSARNRFEAAQIGARIRAMTD
jgi:RNA polymerase sigma-70 factor, ECF subfamily